MKSNEFIKKTHHRGTYAGVHFSESTNNAIRNYIIANDIPNPVPADKLHCTLLYSRKHCPDYEAQGQLDTPIIGKPGKFEIWPGQPEEDGHCPNCLVLNFESTELEQRHQHLMDEHKATFDYPEYKTHVTFSYDVGDMKLEDIPEFTDQIEIVEEYGERLSADWAKENAVTESEDKLTFLEVVELFQDQHADKIKRGCKRGECAIPASYFSRFAREHGYTARRIDGFFKVDYPEFDEMDFHTDELDQMEEEGLDSSSKEDRVKFASKHNMIEELMMVPHQWNEHKGKIIDFTAKAQFIDTGLASDAKRKRYFKE